MAAGTAKKSFTGELFHAPCLANLKPKDQLSDGGQSDNRIIRDL